MRKAGAVGYSSRMRALRPVAPPPAVILTVLLLAASACGGGGGAADGGADAGPTGTPPEAYCPGQPGCEAGYGSGDAFLAGGAAVPITPEAFEVPRPEYLERSAADGRCDVGERCGALNELAFEDCGTDGICPGSADWVAADADGTEKDGVYDFFDDCGSDRLCPGDDGYPGPDADGTEANGVFDGMWLAGFDNSRPATGVHDDIWARAAVFGRGDVRVALVYVDLVGFFFDDVERVRARIAEARPDVAEGLDFVFVGSTHVHEAPDGMGQWGMAPNGIPGVGLPPAQRSGVNGPWMDWAIGRMADAVIEAYDGARPAKARFATGRTGVEGLIRDSRDPKIVDDTLSLIQAVDAETGETVVTIVNWGNHPEVLSGSNNLVTSDFPDALRTALEEGLPAEGSAPAIPGVGGVALYAQGSVGGLLTPLGNIGAATRDGTPRTKSDWEKARAVGQRVAEKALALLQDAEEVERPGLAFRAQTFLLPMDNAAFQFVFGLGVFDRRQAWEWNGEPWNGEGVSEMHQPYLKSQMVILEVGPATLMSVPGELFSELAVGFGDTWTPAGQDRISPDNPNPPDLSQAPEGAYKDRLRGRYPFVLGLGLDEVGYLVPPYDFKLADTIPYLERPPGDHYEETNSLGPQTVPEMEKTLDLLLDWGQTP